MTPLNLHRSGECMTNATHSSLARLYRCAVCDRRRRIQWTRVEMRLYAGQPGRDETVSCGSAIRSHKRPSLCVGRGPGGTKRAGLASAPAASSEVDRTGQLHVVVGRVCMCTCGNLLLRSSHRYSHKVGQGQGEGHGPRFTPLPQRTLRRLLPN